MEQRVIRHRARHFDHTLLKRVEMGLDCLDCPDGSPHITAICPDCDCAMMYRGVGRLHSGTLVHYFECIHSHREVHSVSFVIAE